jgi:hypothetical protein
MRLSLALIALVSTPLAIAQSMPPLLRQLEATKVCDEKGACTYRAGKDLRFTITGIGTPNTGIVFERSLYEGDYYASIGVSHGCVIVHNGKAKPPILSELAFVSPTNGHIYSSWQECQQAKR